MPLANVAIPKPLHTAFTYIAPEDRRLTAGVRVIVPFAKRRAIGIVLGIHDEVPPHLDARKLKRIEEILDEEPVLSPSILKLLEWMSKYYCNPIGEVCRAALPARLLDEKSPRTTRATAPVEIMPLEEKGFELNASQQDALDSIISSASSKRPATFLLHGITGSGKTEIYLRLITWLAKGGRQGLLLVPEIGLAPQLAGRAAARFGNRVAVYHSGLTDAQRHDQWMRMRRGDIDAVVGTRSALFAPLPNLGAIVVDEEHDSSYKQDEGGITYHGRDAAVMRAHIEGVAAVLGSATPSLESFANVRLKKYVYHRLPERTAGASLPSVEIVDMRAARRKPTGEPSEGSKKRREFHSLSPDLYDAIASTLEKKEQALLYVGRRGFASSLQCSSCGFVFSCPNCDISLVAHRARAPGSEKLTCHYCDYKIAMPGSCRECGTPTLIPLGHGTQRLEAELADFFPQARIARLDSDAISSATTRQRIFDRMRSGKIDILVGTQMVTKGHDFPSITLVGVVAADQTLGLPDFRSAERTFQLVTQVAGRAGRGVRPGRVIIQTRQPDHFSITAAKDHDFDAFAAKEIDHRRLLGYPPMSRLANIRLSSSREDAAAKSARQAAAALKRVRAQAGEYSRIAILGPAPAHLAKLRGRFRWQILIKAPSSAALTDFLSRARRKLEDGLPSQTRLTIDVDPVNLL